MLILPVALLLLRSPLATATQSCTGNAQLGVAKSMTPTMPVSRARQAKLIAEVANCIDPQLVAEILAARDPNTRSIVIVDLWSGQPGSADSGTIGLDLHSDLPDW